MAYLKLISFSGIAPQISPRLIGETIAQTAEDVILDSGRLVPLRNNTDAYTLSTTGQNSIAKYETGGSDYWLEWADEGVDVVLGPIAGDATDRVYWTGEHGSFPRMSNNTLVRGAAITNLFPIAFDSASASIVIVADDTITLTELQYNSLSTATPVTYTAVGGSAVGGLTSTTVYYVIKGTSPKIQLATTASNAVAGTDIDLTAVGVGGAHTLTLAGRYPRASYRLGIPAPELTITTATTGTTVYGSAFAFNGASAVTAGADTITLTTAQYDSLSVGDVAQYSNGGGTTVQGLTNATFYYIIKGTSPAVKLATSLANATAGTAVDITGDGAGASHSLTLADDKTQIQYSTSYVYTFVSAYGEEGPPSAASLVFDKVDGQTVTVSNMSTTAGTAAGRTHTNITHKRIYRSNTGSNTTAFQFVAQVTLATTSYNDATDNSSLAELIPSTYWIGPPNEVTADYPNGSMAGLTAMPNGIFAGFTGKRLCFSEPYLPHAWPVAYRVTIEETIVGIKMAGQGLVVTTEGTPYIVAGTDPQSMSLVRIEAAQACLNKNSMVDMGPYVLYAGADGLVAVSGTEVDVVTEGLVSPEQWRADYYPSALRGFLWEGRYVGLYTSGSNYGGFIFDPRGDQQNILTTLSQTSATDASGGFTDPDDNELYVIVETGSGPRIQKFQGATSNKTFTWKSREYVPERPASMSFLKVDAEAYPVVVKVYGNGSLIYHATFAAAGSVYTVTGTSPSFSAVTISEPVVRLPSGVYKSYAIEVQSATVVNEVCIAESIDELRGV